jgi:hypothetical protein
MSKLHPPSRRFRGAMANRAADKTRASMGGNWANAGLSRRSDYEGGLVAP